MNKVKLLSLSLSYFLISTIWVFGVSVNDISSILIYNSDPDLDNWGFKRFSIKTEDKGTQRKSTSSERKEEAYGLSSDFVFADNEQVQFTELRNIIWECVNKYGREGSERLIRVVFQDDLGDLSTYSMSIRSYLYLVDTLNEKLYLSGTTDVKQLRVLMRFNMNWLAIPASRAIIDM